MSTLIQVVLLLCVHWFCIKPSSLTNCPDSSDHLEPVYCLSPQLEINTVKQNLVSMHHISVTNSHNCRSAEPSMSLKQDWRIPCLLLPFRKFSLLHCNSFYFLFAWFLMIYFNIVCLNVLVLCVSFALAGLMWSTLSCLVAEMCFINTFALPWCALTFKVASKPRNGLQITRLVFYNWFLIFKGAYCVFLMMYMCGYVVCGCEIYNLICICTANTCCLCCILCWPLQGLQIGINKLL